MTWFYLFHDFMPRPTHLLHILTNNDIDIIFYLSWLSAKINITTHTHYTFQPIP
eukprot:c20083_g2_i1 orf=100-261(-)